MKRPPSGGAGSRAFHFVAREIFTDMIDRLAKPASFLQSKIVKLQILASALLAG
jgi:hypothetical protein